MNELEVGISPDQEIVILRINGHAVALPSADAVVIGATIQRAGVQLSAKTAPADCLPAIAEAIAALTAIIDMATDAA